MDRKAVANFVKEKLKDERTGHDFYHGERVAKLAEKMYLADYPAGELADIVYTAGFVHDVIDEKVTDNPDQSLQEVLAFLKTQQLSLDELNDIEYTITHMSYSKNIEHHYELPLIGKYVQDADRIESLGAIGIARAFQFGGKHGNLIYDPAIKPEKLVSYEQYRHHEETTINHFYEKLFHLEKLMNTTSGRAEAHRRTQFMHEFVDEFLKEWNVD
ncbi:MAG: HD domain-containing protein [Lactobacillus sp.]|nr:HD domain-containing protein [Lactobacillus sp.]